MGVFKNRFSDTLHVLIFALSFFIFSIFVKGCRKRYKKIKKNNINKLHTPSNAETNPKFAFPCFLEKQGKAGKAKNIISIRTQ